MEKSPYTSRKLLNELKKLEKESEDMMLTHNLHDIAINGKKVGCSGHITNITIRMVIRLILGKCCWNITTPQSWQQRL